MPALKSQVIMPVPPPTLPSATGPLRRCLSASRTCSAFTWRPEMSLSQESSHSPTTGMMHVVLVADAGVAAPPCSAPPRRTPRPPPCVLVSKMGVSIRPHSMSWVRPETSPAPLSTKPPPATRWSMKMLPSLGRMAVTPVRTGPVAAPQRARARG